ncbi:MAG: alpha-xylosidase [Chitinivibrionales bacterium]|nr:alpha-xylosidase [Chitinivibrionales bacterium]
MALDGFLHVIRIDSFLSHFCEDDMHSEHVDLQNGQIDISKDFCEPGNYHFIAHKLTDFNSRKLSGSLQWQTYLYDTVRAFNQCVRAYKPKDRWEFPASYSSNESLPLQVQPVSSRTIRLTLSALPGSTPVDDSPMLNAPPKTSRAWKTTSETGVTLLKSKHAALRIGHDPFDLSLSDATGRLLTKSFHLHDRAGFPSAQYRVLSYVQRKADLQKRMALSLTLRHDEKIFGCGESFTRLDKRGQKLTLWTQDAYGVLNRSMYKPIPFFMSSAGYGVFVHTGAPVTFDFGLTHDQYSSVYGGPQLDLFFFIGSPKQILSEYTALTGRSPVPPLWSFGLWMSRVSYHSEKEVRDVAAKMRRHKIPCDVIHIDTDWFERNWLCDYSFSKSRFPTARKMIKELDKQGFKISLWQLPYFLPDNVLYKELKDRMLAIMDADGRLPTEDAILDFSNPRTVEWYQNKLRTLLKMGVAAIKADFGESAPLQGCYFSGASGLYEHNLYPLRYNKAVADVTQEIRHEAIIWARSAWAGSQRYPVHWGGDSEVTDNAMASSLRAGLSLGLCGFTYWSHDIGGFCRPSEPELYARWMPFGMLTSHSRCHGRKPKEPWPYGSAFQTQFRAAVELKYRLMPYIYSQAVISSRQGWPMMRTLFFEYPDDPSSWHINDQYLFGSDLLVAPLFEAHQKQRSVYLPEGTWIDYHTRRAYTGKTWHTIASGSLPVVVLVKDGAILPHIPVCQSTHDIDWKSVELHVFSADAGKAGCFLSLPGKPAIEGRVEVDCRTGEIVQKPQHFKPSKLSFVTLSD